MRALFLSTLLVFVIARPAAAQLRWVFIADGQVAVPVSGPDDLTQRYAPAGYGGGGGFGAILSPRIMLVFTVNYTFLPIDQAGVRNADGLPDDTTIDGGDIAIWYVSFGARYNLSNNLVFHSKPYVIGGAGWYRGESTDITATSPTIGEQIGQGGYENVFGFDVGAGADIPISPKVDAFVEVQYEAGLTSDVMTATIPFRAGLVFLLGQGD